MSSNSPETKVNPPTPSDSSGSSGDLLNKDKYPQDFPAFHPINRTPQWRDLATLAQSRVMTANDGTSNTPPSSNLAGPAPRRTYRHIAPCPAGTTAPGTPPNSSHARVHTGTPSAPTLVIVHQQQTPPATHGLQQQSKSSHTIHLANDTNLTNIQTPTRQQTQTQSASHPGPADPSMPPRPQPQPQRPTLAPPTQLANNSRTTTETRQNPSWKEYVVNDAICYTKKKHFEAESKN